jgi:hypothetical protein
MPKSSSQLCSHFAVSFDESGPSGLGHVSPSQGCEGNEKAAHFILSGQRPIESTNTSPIPVHREAADSSLLEEIKRNSESFGLVILDESGGLESRWT